MLKLDSTAARGSGNTSHLHDAHLNCAKSAKLGIQDEDAPESEVSLEVETLNH